ncbi:GIY-YIG nuclease family protein [Neisseriaceae bacterium B1]
MNQRTEYINKIIQNCETALQVEPLEMVEIELSITQGGNFITNEQLNKIKDINTAIYIISLKDGDAGKIYQLLKEIKEEKEKSKKEKVCYPKTSENLSNILYVGSSQNLLTRLKQHLNTTSKSTYALHMNRWFTGNIKIKVIKFDSIVTPDILQIIEDSYAYELKPMFGKTGGNNK